MGKESFVVLLFLCFLHPIGVSGQDSLAGMVKKPRVEADYSLRRLADIVAEGGKNGGPKAFRVQAIFTGKTRIMPAERKTALADWANAFAGNPSQYIQDYQSEIEVLEGKTGYWLGIQAKDLQAPKALLVAGSTLDFFLICVGWNMELSPEPLVGKSGKIKEVVLLVEYVKRNSERDTE